MQRVIGLIANPLSGKDIRRVVSHATLIPSYEKVGTIRRILAGAAAAGAELALAMPDPEGLVLQALEGLDLAMPVRLLEMPLSGTAQDSTLAAQLLQAAGARCLVALGGDGTCRAVARGCGDLPMLPISTGTNNAFPLLVEATLAGMAAALFAASPDPALLTRAPRLDLLLEGSPVDMALVDIAAYQGGLGARAIWELEHVRLVVTTRLQPGTLGLSAIGGALGAQAPASAIAIAVTLGNSAQAAAQTILAPVAPGLVRRLPIAGLRWLGPGDQVELPQAVALAMDGEREHLSRNGRWSARASAEGPLVLDVQRTLARA